MKRTLINIDANEYPADLRCLLDGAKIYDSSCSPFAKVVFVDKGEGYYIKSSEKNSLKSEYEMTKYFASKGLTADVLCYVSDEKDWLVTHKIKGEDCTYGDYLENPERLCDKLAYLLRELHETDYSDCPQKNRNALYLETARENYRKGMFDGSYLTENVSHLDAVGAYKYITERKDMLKCDVLLHGDYCLPNILLDGFEFSGFIDLGNGGVGDRHIDLFWGAWTLNYNLKTDRYRNRFFDAYGRKLVDEEMIDLISVFETFG